MNLPDCAALVAPEGLSRRQHRELVRLLAEEGPGGLEAWLRKEEARDPLIRRRLQAARERLERQARAEQARLRDAHDEESRAAASAWEARMQEQAEKEADLRSRLDRLHARPLLTQADLKGSLLGAVAESSPTPGLWQKIRSWLRMAWVFIVALWVRFVRALTGRKATPRRMLVLPDGAPLPRGLGPDAFLAVQDDLRKRPWRNKMKDAWDRLLGREDYQETVERMMADEMARLEEAARARREAEERELQERLGQDKDATEEARKANEREAERRRRRLEENLAALARRQEGAYQELRDELLGDLAGQGLVDAEGRPTARLMDRFSKLLYDEARRTIPAGGETMPGTYIEGEGEYEMGPLRSSHEMGAIDLVSSVVRARLNHPHIRHLYDDDVLVHREVRSATAHVVLVFDTSGSMEGARLDAAKRVCLVLHRAVKDRNPDHRVDLLEMNTSVRRVDLATCWNAAARGFTNHGAAMREGKRLLDEHGADSKVLYLITDGLPEAYTRADGVDKPDRPDVCMKDALHHAAALRDVPGLRTVVLQLETQDEAYLEAAAQLAKAADGRVEGIDPDDLMAWVLADA